MEQQGSGVLANAKQIGQQELQNLDKAVWQAQSAASHTGGGGGSYTSSAAITGIVHSVPGEGMMEATSSHRPLVGARRGTSSLAANNISLRKQMPAATPVSAVAAGGVTAQSISAVETPWTGTNTGLPAYPSQSTPQMPAKPTGRIAGAQAAGQSSDSNQLRPQMQPSSIHPGAGLAHRPGQHASAPSANAGMGLDVQAVPSPVQDGPLAHYPDFSVVDASKKWQRIQEWVSRDSGVALAGGGEGQPPLPPPSVGTAADDAHSVDSTLLELELERTRTSVQAGQLNRAVNSVRGPSPAVPIPAASSNGAGAKAHSAALPQSVRQPGRSQAAADQPQQTVKQHKQSVGHHSRSGPPSRRRTAEDAPALPLPQPPAQKPPFASALQQHMQQQRPPRPPAPSHAQQQQQRQEQQLPLVQLHHHRQHEGPLANGTPAFASHHAQPGHSGSQPASKQQQQQHAVSSTAGKELLRLLDLDKDPEEGSGETAPLAPPPHRPPTKPASTTNPHLQQYSKLLESSSNSSSGSNAGDAGMHVPAPVSHVSIPTASRSHGLAAAQELTERVELESRLRAAEEQMAASEKRYALDKERMQVRIAALEASLASEHELSARLQQQVASELQRGRALAQAEEQARSAEQRAEGALAGTRKTLEAERRRAAEAARAAAASAAEEGARLRAALEDGAALERRLAAERETKARLQRQIANLRKAEEDSRTSLARSEAARSDQERRLEAASSQVAAMRGELASLNARLTARDELLLKHVQEVEAHEVQVLRDELAGCRAQLASQTGAQAALRQCVLSVAQWLSPDALREAFSYKEHHLQGFSTSAEQHRALVARLDAAASDSSGASVQVTAEDAAAVAARVREVLEQAKEAVLQAERQEAALSTEADATADILRAQLVEAQRKLEAVTKEEGSRVAALTAALRTTTSRVEELMEQAASAQAEVLAAEKQAAQGEAALRRQLEQASAHWSELEQEAASWQAHAEQRDQQLKALEQQLQAAEGQAQQSRALAEAKEQRITELRAALAHAMQGASNADDVAAQQAAQQRAVQQAEDRAAQQAQHAVQQAQQAAEQAIADAKERQAKAEDLMQQVEAEAKEAEAAAQHAQAEAEGLRHAAEAARAKADEAVSQLQGQTQDLEAQVSQHAAMVQELQQGQQSVARALEQLRSKLQKVTASLWAVGKQQAQGAEEGDEGVQGPEEARPGGVASSADQQQQQQEVDGADGDVPGVQEALLGLGAEVQQALNAGKAVGAAIAAMAGGLRAAHAQLQEEQAKAEQSRHVSQEHIAQLEGALAQAEQAAAKEKELLEMDSGARAAHLAELLATAQAQQAQLEQQLADMERGAEGSRQQLQDAADARDALQEQLQRAEHQISQLQHALQQQQEHALEDASHAQQSLQALEQQLQEQAQAAMQAQHLLQQQLQRQAEEGAQQLAAVRRQCTALQRQATTDRCRARVARVRRKGGQTALSMQRQSGRRLRAKLAARNGQLRAGALRLQAALEDEAAARARVAELEARTQRADVLLHKMEDRRAGLENERRGLLEKLSTAQSQAADFGRALEAARRTEASLRRELEAAARHAGQVSAAESRSATLMEALEGAELALRESQANSQRLLQEVHMLREAEQQARADLATAHEGVTQLQACIAQQQQQQQQQQLSKHPLHLSARQSPAATASPASSTDPPSPAHSAPLSPPPQLHALPQGSDAASSRTAAAAEAECQMLRRQLRRAQLQLQQLQQQQLQQPPQPPPPPQQQQQQQEQQALLLAGASLPAAGPPSLHNNPLWHEDIGEGGSSCAASSYAQPQSHLNLAHVGAVVQQAQQAQGTQPQRQEALQVVHIGQQQDMHAVALSAKEARIFELRGALAQCRAERGALVAQLEAAGGPGGQAAAAYQLELQQELADLRQQTLAAQRRLCDCQQQLAKSQTAQEASSQAVVDLELALREAQLSSELQLAQLATQQQQVLHAVRSVRTELQGHQQHALVEDMTSSTQLRIELEGAHKQQHALEQYCARLDTDLGCTRTRLSVLQEEVGAMSEQLQLALHDAEVAKGEAAAAQRGLEAAQQQAAQHQVQLTEAQAALQQAQEAAQEAAVEADRVVQEAEQQRAQLRDQLAQHQAAAAEAQQAAQEASAEAAAARRDDEEEVAEARAALAAREEWVASLQAEASMLQEQCSSLQAQMHSLMAPHLAADQHEQARGEQEGHQAQEGEEHTAAEACSSDQELAEAGQAEGRAPIRQVERTLSMVQLRAQLEAAEAAQRAAEASSSAAEEELRGSQAGRAAAEASVQDLASQLEEAQRRAEAREAQVVSLQQQCSAAAQGSSEELCTLREQLLEADLAAQEGARTAVSAQEAQARLAAALAAAEAEQQEGARAVREAQAQAKQQAQNAARLQQEVEELRRLLEAQPSGSMQQPEVRGNPEQHERDDVRLAQLQQQLQQQQALAKREVRVAMVALEEAEAKAECQVEQLATTIQELEALRCCLKDESDVRQRAEAMLAEREQEYSAQVQAAEEAEAKSRLLADAVAQWQEHHRSAETRCAELAGELAQARAAVAEGRAADVVAAEAEQLRQQLEEVERQLEELQAQVEAEGGGAVEQLESALSAAQAQLEAGATERALLRQQLQEALEVGAALQADGVAVRKRHGQEVARMQAQLAAANAGAEGLEAQQAAQASRQAQYVCEVEAVRSHLEACLQELQRERLLAMELRAECEALHEQAALSRDTAEQRHGAFSCPTQSDAGGSWSSSLGVGALSAPPATDQDPSLPQRFATVFEENRELISMLDRTHTKLKVTKARAAQAEALLAATQEGGGQGETTMLGAPTDGSSVRAGHSQTESRQQSRLEAYKAALMAAQEQAAISSNQAAEARARISALEAKLLRAQQGRKQKLHASSELLSSLRASRQLRRSRDQDSSKSHEGRENDAQEDQDASTAAGVDGGDMEHQVAEQLRAQQAESQALRRALDAAHAARAAEAEEAARVSLAWSQSTKQVRLLEEQVKSLEQQLQRAAASRQAHRQQQQHHTDQQYHEEWSSSSLPSTSNQSGGDEGTSALSGHDGGAAAAAHIHQQRQLDEVADTWKQACLARAQHVSDLEAELDVSSQQIRVLQKQLASKARLADKLERKVQRMEQEQRSHASKTNIDHEALMAQVVCKDEQVRALGAQVSSYEANAIQLDQQLAACQVDLKCVQDRMRSKDAQNADLRAQLEQQAARARAREVELARLQAEMQQATAAHQRGAKQMDRELGRLVLSLRELLLGAGTPSSQLLSPQQPQQQQQAASEGHAEVPSQQGPSNSSGASHSSNTSSSSSNLTGLMAAAGSKPLQHLHALLDVVADVLSKRDQQAAYAAADLRACRGEARRLEADVKALEARVMSQSENASCEREQLTAAEQEAATLRARLARKEADFSTVEAEIQRQIGDYERLKARLLKQERDGGRLAAAQDVLARKCDELQAALAAKQADCAAAAVRASQLQEALSVARQNHQAAQERLKALELQKDTEARSSSHASKQLAATQAELDESVMACKALQEQLDKKGAEIRELHQMLKAWEAMRLGKDAQITGLLERCKRHEEEAAEKARTVDSLRRKLSGVGRSVDLGSSRPFFPQHDKGATVRRSCTALFGSHASSARNASQDAAAADAPPLPPVSASAVFSREGLKASLAGIVHQQQQMQQQPAQVHSRSSAASHASSATSSAV